jgi:hypothetical protein
MRRSVVKGQFRMMNLRSSSSFSASSIQLCFWWRLGRVELPTNRTSRLLTTRSTSRLRQNGGYCPQVTEGAFLPLIKLILSQNPIYTREGMFLSSKVGFPDPVLRPNWESTIRNRASITITQTQRWQFGTLRPFHKLNRPIYAF